MASGGEQPGSLGAARAADPGDQRERRTNSDEEELVMFLERDQLSYDRARRLARLDLDARAHAGLLVLRAFTLIVGAMVIYTFIVSLH
jgi:hypothetical protein